MERNAKSAMWWLERRDRGFNPRIRQHDDPPLRERVVVPDAVEGPDDSAA